MKAELTCASGRFAALTARMLRLELEKAGIQVSETASRDVKQSDVADAPAMHIYVDANGNTELRSRRQASDNRYFKYPFRVDAFTAAALRCAENKENAPAQAVQAHDSEPGVLLFPDSRCVKINGSEIRLTEREYRLLCYLYERRGSTVSRQELADNVWSGEAGNNTNVIEVYVSYLRNKLEAESGTRLILTRRGRGYEFRADIKTDPDIR